ncbi:class I adenylate-forming enzyme family protein [Mycolicibacterium stellerae]|uniref:class I adenylate-forming enzyme family protein n=1 Tax=Mycolicibacterium stellerae TaxID=2358193 RepID=UPI000F0B1C0D|nr:class I adenylate-forming enzyme family protein [Mycolicibacterium stellerae]
MTPPDILSLLDRADMRGPALEDATRSVGYAELGPNVRVLAAALLRAGTSPGDRVVVVLPNSAAAVEMYLACALLGAIWVGVNPSAPAAEQNRQCAVVDPAVVVTTRALASSCTSLAGRVVTVEELTDDPARLYEGSPPAPSVPVAIGFSSGTTGTPKAVVHNRAAVSLTASVMARVQVSRHDRVGVILPMSIHNLLVVGALPALFTGATCVPVERMNARGVASACHDRRLTHLNALVPTTIYDLVHDDAITPRMLASLRLAGTGAAGLSEKLREAFEVKFGVRLVGSYGMTEAPGVVCIEDCDAPHEAGASGKALPYLRVDATDNSARRLPPGHEGELVVSAVATGEFADLYRPAMGVWTENGLRLRMPADTSLCTGDRGWVGADGNVHVTGRQADVILRGGVNVNAAELEAILGQLPGVRDVAVTGERDERLGQRIIAFVEPTSAGELDSASLRRQAQEVLPHGKVPDSIIVRTLPRNAMGKVARKELAGGVASRVP